MNTKSIVTDVYVDLTATDVTGIVGELETAFNKLGLDGPQAAKTDYPNLFALYNGLFHSYVVPNRGASGDNG